MTGIMTVWYNDGTTAEMTPKLTTDRRGIVKMPKISIEEGGIFLGKNGPLEQGRVWAIALTYKHYAKPKNQMEEGTLRSDIYLAGTGFRKVTDIRDLTYKEEIFLKVEDDSRWLNRKVGRK